MLVSVLGSVPYLRLAVEPAQLPHYGHTAAVVGSVIILSIIALMAGASFLWSKRG
jgi:hypothetical protein